MVLPISWHLRQTRHGHGMETLTIHLVQGSHTSHSPPTAFDAAATYIYDSSSSSSGLIPLPAYPTVSGAANAFLSDVTTSYHGSDDEDATHDAKDHSYAESSGVSLSSQIMSVTPFITLPVPTHMYSPAYFSFIDDSWLLSSQSGDDVGIDNTDNS